jgi:hypothetical protein
MNRKQVTEIFKFLDTEKNRMKRFTRSSLRQQANAVMKQRLKTIPPTNG